MLGRCPRSSLNRTTSKAELRTDSDEIVHLSCSEDEKPVLQPPHQIVIGFDLGTDSSRSSHIQTAGASPRSVLEPHHLCVRSHHEPVRSPLPPLSLLGTLPSGNPRNLPCVEGVALHFKAAIKAEEAVASGELQHAFPRRGVVAGDVDGVGAFPAVSNREHVAGHSKTNTQNDPLTFSRTSNAEARKDQPCKHGPSNHVSRGSRANCLYAKRLLSSDGEDEDTIEAAAADADSKDVDNLPVSLFSTASQVANNFRSETIAVDFLSKCYLCRRHLVSGKDIYMYRGDRAFCSKECRYKQIVIDERKERRPAAATCVPGASGHHRSFQRTNQAAVA